jgi:hypothetical protein
MKKFKYSNDQQPINHNAISYNLFKMAVFCMHIDAEINQNTTIHKMAVFCIHVVIKI